MELTHPQLQVLADEVESFLGRWFRNNATRTMLVMAGETGCGKSHVIERMYLFVRGCGILPWQKGHWKSPPSIHFLRWPEVGQLIQEKEMGWMRDLYEADLALIDDVGAENDPWKRAADCICQILSRRAGKFTVITTNVAFESWPEKFDVRVADRLFRGSVLVDLASVPSFVQFNQRAVSAPMADP